MAAIGKGIADINTVMPVVQQLIPNISLPLAAENDQMQNAAIQAKHQEMAHQFASDPNTQVPDNEGQETTPDNEQQEPAQQQMQMQ